MLPISPFLMAYQQYLKRMGGLTKISSNYDKTHTDAQCSSTPLESPNCKVVLDDNGDLVSIGGFSVPPGPIAVAKTSSRSTLRRHWTIRGILRACQLDKPILLEGSPGVGKTSLVAALAALTRNNLCRVNLSDQTDLMDLLAPIFP